MPRRGLLPGAGVTAAGATVVAPPPMTIWPGLPPGIYTRFAGTGTGGAVTWFPTGRDHPKVAEFTRLEEKTCVSCKPRAWLRNGTYCTYSASACGESLSPSLMV